MRELILAALMDKIGQYVSGQQLSEALGCTRAAVWKHIQALKEDGYRVDAVPRLGYCLRVVPDIVEPYFIKQLLETRQLGREIQHVPVLDSTNQRAKMLAEHGAPNGMLVLAEEQTNGRGRMGKSWASAKGKGVWMSLVLRPTITPADAQKITMMAAVAMAQAIEKECGIRPGIKWPNDILIGTRKVCGILTEMNTSVDEVRYCIVGTGVNVNHDAGDFPPELEQVATSLKMECGHEVSRTPLIVSYLNALEPLLEKFIETREFSSVLALYRPYSVTLGRDVHITGPGLDLEGTALYFDDEGMLVVLGRNGRRERVFSGEVHVRGLLGQ
nr:biotin--[acetyl-CoA-carboxylase] ligase [bacterium]